MPMKFLNRHRILISQVLLLFLNANVAAAVPEGAAKSSAASPALAKIDELIRLGTPELALSFVDKLQPEISELNVKNWLLLEQKRFQLLARLEQWKKIVQRTQRHEKLFEEILVTYADQNWFKTQRIKALMQQEKYTSALKEIQQSIWDEKSYVDSDVISLWRRLIIRSYLNLGWVDDAQRALRRYQQDYGDFTGEDAVEWKLLQAQLLMRTERPVEAVRLLEKIEQPEAHALLLLARMQAKLLSDQVVYDQVNQLLQNPDLDDKQRSVYWYVLLNVAVHKQEHIKVIRSLENIYYLKQVPYVVSVFSDAQKNTSVDYLWGSYEKHGLHLANKYNLLRGDDQAWYIQASNLFENDPIGSKSLLSVLVFNAQQQQHRHLAMQQLVSLLDKNKNGLDLINHLFMHSTRFPEIEQVPVEVRYRLVDFALSRADLNTAAILMEKLQQPPEGQDLFDWSLRRARVLILGGQYVEGKNVLVDLLKGLQEAESKQVDQYLQVVFDLQSVQQHQLALDAFYQLERLPLSAKLNREIAFWKAESYQQMEEYEQAAFLFLKSAIPLEEKIDPWFHTASFRAAESLAQAGLTDDARRQYLKLLRFTVNPARKAVIQQRLQQLRLEQSKKLTAVGVD